MKSQFAQKNLAYLCNIYYLCNGNYYTTPQQLNMRKFIIALATVLITSCANKPQITDNTVFVDPMVGTGQTDVSPSSDIDAQHGQTIPAVLVPNGMNFWTAVTEPDTEKKSVSPYYYFRDKIRGFRNSHWIVGGCTQDYGSVSIMPVFGELKCTSEDRASSFTHDKEVSTPYYYSVDLLDYDIKAEMTGTSRTGIFRFTFNKGGEAHLIIAPNSDEGMGEVTINTEEGRVTGTNPVHRIYQGWGEYAGFNGYFNIETKKEITAYGVANGDTIAEGAKTLANKGNLAAYITFNVEAGEEVLVKVSSSFCDVDGAKKNMTAENPDWDFDKIKNQLHDTWVERLAAIEVETPDSIAKQKFYTSLYHSSFLPHAINDADGRYPTFAGNGTFAKTDGTYYDDYSMWDTYRAEHPLLSILYPQQSGEMIQSLLDKYDQGGWLPIFPCWNSFTSEMIGDHCASLITDAYMKGIRNFDIDKAWEALRKNAFEQPDNFQDYADGKGRRALDSYTKYGYIPLEDPVNEAFHKGEQVSRTLEYAYDDFVLSILAEALGHKEEAAALKERSKNYKNVFDPATGWAQGRHEDGTFLKDDNVTKFCPFITEGYPAHYSWYVPHDVYGLMEVMGGKERYIEKLDSMFSENIYWHGNEPCHQVAFMFNYAGQPWKTQKVVRHIMNTEYNVGADGLSGNDDAGQMSAWYIFASLGFYPVCPGSPYYIIASPSFTKATIHMSSGKTFTLIAPNASEENIYIKSVKLNGKPYDKNYLHHEDIANGGTMEFEMTNEPCKEWGSKSEACPPSLIEN